MAKKVLRDEEKKKDGAAIERTGEDGTGGRSWTGSVDAFLVQFGRFSEEASQHIHDQEVVAAELAKQVTELTARVDVITALVNQLNGEMSKLTGDLYRIAAVNDTFHRDIATLIAELARSLPGVVDARIAAIIEEVPAEEKPTEEKTVEEKNPE